MASLDPRTNALKEAVSKAGVRNDCPLCGHTVWGTFQTPGLIPAEFGGGEGLGALVMSCRRCGFVRLHAATVLDQYMDPRASE